MKNLRDKLLQEIENELCSYYEAATDHVCTEEQARLMGNKDWADTILYRVITTIFPDQQERVAFWDLEDNTITTTRPLWVKEILDEK